MKLVFFPVFESSHRLYDFLYRTSWYLYPLRKEITEIVFYVKDISILHNKMSPSVYLDPSLADILCKFACIKTVVADGSLLEDSLSCANYVFIHKEESRDDLFKIKTINKYKFEIVRVDHECVQYADSFFLKFTEKFSHLYESYKKIGSKQSSKLLRPLIKKKCYLFGTGPNFSLTENYDFSDGIVVACNSMVVNKDVVDRIKPDIFVIADPIFHAGPSRYAASFRNSFEKILSDKTCPIVVPLRDYHIYSCYLSPSIVERLIPIEFKPYNEKQGPNLDVIASPYVTVTSNILTLFQIPLAATFSDEIYISGCDGRPMSQNNYFWSHDKKVQINEEMDSIKVAHPAFFVISYDDYYNKHIATLRNWVESCEKIGKHVFNLTPSYIPVLQERTVDNIIRSRLKNQCKVSVIIPLYNAENYLGIAVKSILDENIDDIEILIVDDFSEDKSLHCAKELAENHSQVKVWQNFYKKGVSGARNTGIEISSGEYICFLDSDDTVLPGSLKNRIKALDENKDFSIAHSTVKFINVVGDDLHVEVGTRRNVTFNDMSGNPASFNTIIVRRNILKFLRFDENLSNGEDWLALAKLLRKGFKSLYVPLGQSTYRVHSESTVVRDMFGHEDKLTPVIDWIYSDVEEGEACDEYKSALIKPSKKEILESRKLTGFIWSIFSCNLDYALNLLKREDFLLWMTENSKNISDRLRVPFVRFFGTPYGQNPFLEKVKKNHINSILIELETRVDLSTFCDEIRKLICFADDEIDIGIIGRNVDLNICFANKLYREGEYRKALYLYKELFKRGDVYNSLKVNIMFCEKALRADLCK